MQDAVIHTVGLTLLHFLWEGVLIGAVAAVALRVGARLGAHYRYVVCLCAMAGCLVAPLLTALIIAQGPVGVSSGQGPVAEPSGVLAVSGAGYGAGDHQASRWTSSDTLMSAAVALWLLGASLVAVYYVVQWVGVERVRRSAFPLRVPLALATAAAAAVRRWQQTINVPVMLSTAIVTPIVIGLWRPMVIFPAAMVARMSVADFELILLHELAHIVRRDAWVNAMQVVLEILLFYHPVVHWLSRRTRLERECACDDFAVQASGSAYEYARALASLGVGVGSVFALSLGAAGGDLLPRLRNLAGEPAEDEGFLRSPANFAVLLALLLCLIWIRPQLNVQWHPSETLGALRVADAPEALSVSSASSRHRTPETQREVSPPALTPAEALTSPPAAAPRRMRPARQTRQARPSPAATLTGSTSAGATASVDRGVAPPDAEHNRAELSAISGHAANDTLPAANETLPVLTPVYSPAPAYPLRARLDGIEGTVQVGLRIGADGRPTGLQIVDARPLGVFEGAVRQALMKWRYEVSDAGKSSRELTAFYRLSFSLSGVTSATTSICATATASRTCRAP